MSYAKPQGFRKSDAYEQQPQENYSKFSQEESNQKQRGGHNHQGRYLYEQQQSRQKPQFQQANVPSFVTQVTRDGKPQRFDDDDGTDVEELRPVKRISIIEKICRCLRFRKAPQLDVEMEESDPEESKQAHPPQSANNQAAARNNGVQMQMQNQHLQQQQHQQMQQQQQARAAQKQRGPLQTNTPRIMLPQEAMYHGKKSLVIDLDETLVHSSFTLIQNADFTLQITVQNMPFTVYVKKRPGCEFFLEELCKYYELIIYTASLSEYANPVMDKIDPNRVCALRLFRENCTLYKGIFVKDMSLMCRDLKDLIIIDNSETSFMFQPANAVHIKSFFDDMKDTELYRLIPVLVFLSNTFDVRHVGNWWREFESKNYIDYRDKKNVNQRLDKQKMLEELGDLRQRELQMIEEEQLQLSSECLNHSPTSQISPKSSAVPLQRQERQQQEEKKPDRPKRKEGGLGKKKITIDVPTDDLLIAPRSQSGQDSVRKLLNTNPSPAVASVSQRKNPGFKFNEFEDYVRSPSSEFVDDDPHNFKTQPDALEEDSESYKEMKQIFDNIRYSTNVQNINSPVSKERFVQLLHSNSHRKMTERAMSSPNAEAAEPHFFASAKRQQANSNNNNMAENSPASKQNESNAQLQQQLTNNLSKEQNFSNGYEELEITNKDSDEQAIIVQDSEFNEDDDQNNDESTTNQGENDNNS